MSKEVRVAFAFTHAEAVDEACRRLRVMAEKWPETPWRMRVRRTRSRVNRRWRVWTVYAIVPKDHPVQMVPPALRFGGVPGPRRMPGDGRSEPVLVPETRGGGEVSDWRTRRDEALEVLTQEASEALVGRTILAVQARSHDDDCDGRNVLRLALSDGTRVDITGDYGGSTGHSCDEYRERISVEVVK